MNTTSSPLHPGASTSSAPRRALVLGGGGSTGNAWLIGVVAGLFDAGVDVTTADLTVGTSAGSTAAAQLSGATPTELYAAILAATPPQHKQAQSKQAQSYQAQRDQAQSKQAQRDQASSSDAGSERRRDSSRPVSEHLERMRSLIASSENAADMRRRVGAAALERDALAGESRQAQWRATVASRLPSQRWPERTLLITAVDAESGEPVVFDRQSGIELADAVAASCSSGFTYGIDGHRYIDGGYRSNAENADLAAGYARVLVLSPFGGRSLTPVGWGTHLATQLDELRAQGGSVETIAPGSDSAHLFGANAMDLSLRPAAARAGHELGRARAEQLAGFWR
jgi:NTE family protein